MSDKRKLLAAVFESIQTVSGATGFAPGVIAGALGGKLLNSLDMSEYAGKSGDEILAALEAKATQAEADRRDAAEDAHEALERRRRREREMREPKGD